MFLKKIATLAKFTPDKMGKSTLAQGDFLFAGLNSFEPGQEHAPHIHEGQDKLYFVVLEGSGVGSLRSRRQGRVADGWRHKRRLRRPEFCIPSAIPGPERLVVMAVLSPPPFQTGNCCSAHSACSATSASSNAASLFSGSRNLASPALPIATATFRKKPRYLARLTGEFRNMSRNSTSVIAAMRSSAGANSRG